MKKLLLLTSILFGSIGYAGSASQVTLHDFDSAPTGDYFGTWVGATSTSGGIFTVGSPADNAGSLQYQPLGMTIDTAAMNFTQITVTARIDAGNDINGELRVVLVDGDGIDAVLASFASSLFNTDSFTSQTIALTPYVSSGTPGNASNIQYFNLIGNGTTGAFRMSIDSVVLSAAVVPEPATYVMFFGLGALVFVAVRRRLTRA